MSFLHYPYNLLFLGGYVVAFGILVLSAVPPVKHDPHRNYDREDDGDSDF